MAAKGLSTNQWIIIASACILICTAVALAVGLTYGLRDNKSSDTPTPFTPSAYKLFSLYAVATDTVACSKIGK